MSKKKRTHRTAAEKARILQRHLKDGESVSEVCESEGIQPSVFYGWRNELFAPRPRCDGQGTPLGSTHLGPGGEGPAAQPKEFRWPVVYAAPAGSPSIGRANPPSSAGRPIALRWRNQQGLGPPSFQIEERSYRFLQSQLRGFYQPKEGRVVLLEQAGPRPDAQLSLAHELVHPLQDQHFGLGPKNTRKAGKYDEWMALKMLAEGDATSGMFEVAYGDDPGGALAVGDTKLTQALVGEKLADCQGEEAGNRTRCRMLRSLLGSYIRGMRFVHALRRHGGWREVNAAWSRGHLTTEQILHPARYFRAEPPLEVGPIEPSLFGKGMLEIGADRLGELALRQIFAGRLSPKQPKSSAEGWGEGGKSVQAASCGEQRRRRFGPRWSAGFRSGDLSHRR